MYTPSTLTDSQMINKNSKINENGAITKVKILLEQVIL